MPNGTEAADPAAGVQEPDTSGAQGGDAPEPEAPKKPAPIYDYIVVEQVEADTPGTVSEGDQFKVVSVTKGKNPSEVEERVYDELDKEREDDAVGPIAAVLASRLEPYEYEAEEETVRKIKRKG